MHMKKLVLGAVIALFVLSACAKEKEVLYVCPDGSTVTDSSLCHGPKRTCIDSDGGLEYYTKGQIDFKEYREDGSLGMTGQPADDCVETVFQGKSQIVLKEYFCDDTLRTQYEYFKCPTECNDGVCK